MAETKYIFVTGGVASSLGKGIISSSIGKLLQARGYSVTIQKFDPYINIDPGTLNPYEHGECYVTVDGHEADLDLGHYERFLGIQTTKANNITTGRIYKSVIDKERRGDYLGKTIQIVPHITDEIKRNIKLLGNKYKFDFVITEIGGTVGDIESLPYLESIRQLKWELGRNALCVHLTYVPYLAAAGELKTKPTQHSVKELQSVGIQPDILVLRAEHELSTNLKKKVALFCNVDENAVVQSIDMPTIYEVPLRMQEQNLDVTILKKMGLPIAQILAPVNGNDSFPNYLKCGEYQKIEPSRNCISNAMNVGHPSNLARLISLFGGQMNEKGEISHPADLTKLKEKVYSVSVSDDETQKTIISVWEKYQLLLEPHGAVGWNGYQRWLEIHPERKDIPAICLETAHPAKFPQHIRELLGIIPEAPLSLSSLDSLSEHYKTMDSDFDLFKQYLLDTVLK